MTGNLVIWLDDEYALSGCTLHDSRNPAVAWLDAQFTSRWATLAYLDDNNPIPGPDCIRPMAELIDPLTDALEDPDASMDIRHSDYRDPGRWWL
jgi:hypothetical protein